MTWATEWQRWVEGAGNNGFLEFLGPRFRPLLPDSGSVLDVGAGEGRWARLLSEAGCNVFTIDKDPDLVAESLGHNFFHQVVGDMAYLPFRSNSFDHCISILSLQECAMPAKAIGEMVRVVKAQGTITLITVHPIAAVISGDDEPRIHGIYGSGNEYTKVARSEGQSITFRGYRHSIQEYVNALIHYGARIDDLQEVNWVTSPRWTKVPRFLYLRAFVEFST